MMTESRWRTAGDPRVLLAPDSVTERYPARKLRLLALALAREVRHLIREDEVLAGFDLAEYVAELPDDHEEEKPVADLIALRRFRTGGATPFEQARMAFCEAIGPSAADDDGYDYLDPLRCKEVPTRVAKLAALATAAAIAGRAPADVRPGAAWHQAFERAWQDANVRLTALTRCVLGNPFQPPAFDPRWRTTAAVELCRSMDHGREFGAMPILADALEEAGCDDPDILAHCRGDGPHARGCWVVDAVLGKG
jgi:hypothetical protein